MRPSGVQSKLMKLWLLLLFAHRYPVEGIVVETNPETRQIIVAHKPIDNYMPAMTMAYHVGRGVDLTKLTPGTRIDFELAVGKTVSLAQKVRVREAVNDLKLPNEPKKIVIGSKIPSFSLID